MVFIKKGFTKDIYDSPYYKEFEYIVHILSIYPFPEKVKEF